MKTLYILPISIVLSMGSPAQTATVGTASNFGACSFTSINAANSTYKVTCGGKGLLPQEAKALAQVLSIVKENKLQFSFVIERLDKLVEEERKKAGTSINCVESACANGDVNAPQTVNNYHQYGASIPAPLVTITDRSKQQGDIPPIKTMAMSGPEYEAARQQYVARARTTGVNPYPSASVVITVDRDFPNPKFAVRCNVPCNGVSALNIYNGGGIITGSGGFGSKNRFGQSKSDSTLALFDLGDNPMITTDQKLKLTVNSLSSDPVEIISVEGYVE